MTTHISKSKMEDIADSCDGIEEGITATGTKVTKQSEPGLEGWQLQGAIGDVNKHWKDKTDHSGRQWRYYASAVRDTASHITSTDKDVSFTFPEVGEGEADIEIPLPFRMFMPGAQPIGPLSTGN